MVPPIQWKNVGSLSSPKDFAKALAYCLRFGSLLFDISVATFSKPRAYRDGETLELLANHKNVVARPAKVKYTCFLLLLYARHAAV